MAASPTSSSKTFLHDAASLQALIEQMPPDELQAYLAFKSRIMKTGFPNRKFVVYTLRGGVPTDLDVLITGDFSVDPFLGLVVQVRFDGGVMAVGLLPVRFKKREVFLHVPQSLELKWKGKQPVQPGEAAQFVPHYALLIKTASKAHLAIEGHTYCIPWGEFGERFPKVSQRY